MWEDNVLGTTNPVGSGQLTYGGGFVDQEADLPLALDPSGNPSWDFQFTDLGKLLSGIGIGANSELGKFLGGIGSILGGKSGSGPLGAFLGSAGLGLLLNKLTNQAPTPVGYQGGIPKYTIERTQTPIAQQRPAGYRPGQGGITYFNPIKYTKDAPPASGDGAPVTGNKSDTGSPVTSPENVSLAHSASGQTTGGNIDYKVLFDALVDPYIPSRANGISDNLGSNSIASLANALNIKTSPAQPDQKQDYGQYGFDPALVSYLNQQRQQSVMDSGVDWTYDPSTQTFSGFTMSGPLTSSLAEMKSQAGVKAASGGYMPGGIAMLARGRYIKGDGDGVSDSVPAKFVGSGRPAALSDGEFVFPARIVAEVGNGSNEAGAKKLYAFMDRVEAKARSAKRGKPSGADKELNRLA